MLLSQPALVSAISCAISEASGAAFELRRAVPVSGGSINTSYAWDGVAGERYFIKLNHACHHAMFVAERAGLSALAATGMVRVPQALAHGLVGEHGFLVLEYLELSTRGNARQLGEQLAALHRTYAPHFGFETDNFIGTTHQPNTWTEDGLIFWREQRLEFQLQLAYKNHGGVLQKLGASLLDALPAFFDGYVPRPSLLHGDLWGGNHGYLADGSPVLFDPAAHYGDRECDVAMTELFGGYPESFYEAYRNSYPLDSGYEMRRDLYNLYHILNHANLFGGSYVRQAEGMMRRLLANG